MPRGVAEAVLTGGAVSSSGGASPGGEPAICRVIYATNPDVDAAGVRAILGDAATSCVLEESNYDRSCAKDSDCAPIGVGNACTVPCGVACPSTAINVHALDRYRADFDKTPLPACPNLICGCPAIGFSR